MCSRPLRTEFWRVNVDNAELRLLQDADWVDFIFGQKERTYTLDCRTDIVAYRDSAMRPARAWGSPAPSLQVPISTPRLIRPHVNSMTARAYANPVVSLTIGILPPLAEAELVPPRDFRICVKAGLEGTTTHSKCKSH